MDEVYVYHSRANQAAAEAFVAELRTRDDVGVVIGCRADRFNPAQAAGTLVYHDGSSRVVVWAHEQVGVPVELFTEPRLQPERSTEPELTVPSGTHTVERAGSWYKLIGPDGAQVGKSKRSEAEAWAILDD